MPKKQHKPKKRERRARNPAMERLEALRREVQSRPPYDRWKILLEPRAAERMSDVLLAFVEPYMEYATTREAYEKLIVIGMTAWNAALSAKEERQAMIDETAQLIQESAGEEDAKTYRAIVDELIKRKLRYFADNQRLIVSYKVTETKDHYHLTVASTLPQKEES